MQSSAPVTHAASTDRKIGRMAHPESSEDTSTYGSCPVRANRGVVGVCGPVLLESQNTPEGPPRGTLATRAATGAQVVAVGFWASPGPGG
jgi:hypothetical protein